MSYNFETSSSNFSSENKTEQSKSKSLSKFHLHVQKGVVQKVQRSFNLSENILNLYLLAANTGDRNLALEFVHKSQAKLQLI